MKYNNCNTNETYIKEHLHNYDNNITFYSNRRFCSKCNNLVYDEELDIINRVIIYFKDFNSKKYSRLLS